MLGAPIVCKGSRTFIVTASLSKRSTDPLTGFDATSLVAYEVASPSAKATPSQWSFLLGDTTGKVTITDGAKPGSRYVSAKGTITMNVPNTPEKGGALALTATFDLPKVDQAK